MKKLFALFAIAGLIFINFPTATFAQDAAMEMTDTTAVETEGDSTAMAVDSLAVDSMAAPVPAIADEAPVEETREVLSFHQTVKRYFIEGGATFMAFVLICLILGLALSIERIIYLNMDTTNTRKLLEGIEGAIEHGCEAAA